MPRHEYQGLSPPVIPTSTGKTLSRGNAQSRAEERPFQGQNRANCGACRRKEFVDSQGKLSPGPASQAEQRSLKFNGDRNSPRPGMSVPGLSEPDRSGKRSRPISRVLSWTTIHLRYASPRTSSDLPGSLCGPHMRPVRGLTARSPIWSCSGRGLPCHRVLPPARCALTAPFHPYRRVAEAARLGGLLSVALSVDSRPPGVTWRLALGARTFLHPCKQGQRLSGRLRPS